MAIDASVGGASSDSFVSVADADAYHDTRLHNSEWTSATTDTKEKALKMATRLLDAKDWRGDLASTTQALRWPRSKTYDRDGNEISSSIIPADIKNATAEYAWELIKSDREVDNAASGIKRVVADTVEVEFDKYDRPTRLPVAVNSMIGFLLLSGGSGTAKLVRA